jgi:hypothetical protein
MIKVPISELHHLVEFILCFFSFFVCFVQHSLNFLTHLVDFVFSIVRKMIENLGHQCPSYLSSSQYHHYPTFVWCFSQALEQYLFSSYINTSSKNKLIETHRVLEGWERLQAL